MNRTRLGVATALLAPPLLVVPAPPAQADVTPVVQGMDAYRAIAETPGEPVSVVSTGHPDARGIGDAPLGGFPLHGDDFLVLSTGAAADADDPSVVQPDDTTTNWGTESAHPDPRPDRGYGVPADPPTVFDLAEVRVTFTAPAGTQCLRFESRFLSEELDEPPLGEIFNDGFRALVVSDLTHGNIAYDAANNLIEVGSKLAPGGTSVYTAANAAGTTYDEGTVVLTHQAPIGPGTHTIRFLVYDGEDGTVDSAVLIDHLSWGPNCYAELPVELTGPASPAVDEEAAYELAVTNPTTEPLPLDELEVTLPAGMEYVEASAAGVTSADPAQDGQVLTWTDSGVLEPGATAALDFTLRPTSLVAGELTASSGAGPNEGADGLTLTGAKGTSAVTVRVEKTKRRVDVTGRVTPAHPDARVRVTLQRKRSGVFRRVDRTTVDLNAASGYATSFRRPAPGACRVVTVFGGDATHHSSTVARKFRC